MEGERERGGRKGGVAGGGGGNKRGRVWREKVKEMEG